MIHIAAMVPVLAASSIIGIVKVTQRALENAKESLEIIEQRAMAEQAACIDRLKLMQKRETLRIIQKKASLKRTKNQLLVIVAKEDEETVQIPQNCRCADLLGTSISKAKGYWFAKDSDWLRPRRQALTALS